MSLVVESYTALSPGPRHGSDAQLPAELEYGFLLDRYVDRAIFSCACALAAQWGVHPHEVLIANGWLAEDDYYQALAEAAGLKVVMNRCPKIELFRPFWKARLNQEI